MMLQNKVIGFGITGSYCSLDLILDPMAELIRRGARVIPVMSESVRTTDTRFGRADEWLTRIREITGEEPVFTIVEAEPIGPKSLLDVMVIAPCTGNTLSKIANAITDGPVLMASKAHLRNGRPLVIAISTNDGLGLNAKNLGLLLNAKNIFFVPFGQDNAEKKPNSLMADFSLIADTCEEALEYRQIQPILLK